MYPRRRAEARNAAGLTDAESGAKTREDGHAQDQGGEKAMNEIEQIMFEP